MLSYRECGASGPGALVLLHSLGADGHMWDGCIDELAAHYRVIIPNTRGHGASSPTEKSSVDLWVDDLKRVLDDAAVDNAVLVGISLGGIQALAFAAAYPDRVAGLVVADSFVAITPEAASAKILHLVEQARQQSMEEVAAQYIADTFEQPYPGGALSVQRAIAAMDTASYMAAVDACFSVQITACLAQIVAPTLVLWGDRDAKTPRPLSEQIATGMKDARLAVVPNAGHLSNVDNPDAFVTELVKFVIDRVELPAPSRAEGGN